MGTMGMVLLIFCLCGLICAGIKIICDTKKIRQLSGAVMNLYQKYRPSLATHVSEFGDALNSLPPVTPKQRTGKWIETTVVIDEFIDEEVTFYVCGCCNERICQPHKYCPNCGAKMEGE